MREIKTTPQIKQLMTFEHLIHIIANQNGCTEQVSERIVPSDEA